MCDQQRLRPACAYAQSDQSLCLSLEYSMSVKLLTEHHLEFLSFKGGCTGSSESTHVKMVHCVKSHALAHLLFVFVSHILSVPCSLVITCLGKVDLLALLYVMFSRVFFLPLSHMVSWIRCGT